MEVSEPSRGGEIQIYAYEDVGNSAELLSMIGEGTANNNFAAVDLRYVCSIFHIQCAVSKALLNQQQNAMKTKSLSSEILYLMSPTTKITESLRMYGMKADSRSIAFVCIDGGDSCKELLSAVQGNYAHTVTPVMDINDTPSSSKHDIADGKDIEALLRLTPERIADIIKLFRITQFELDVSSLEDAVVTRLATKDTL
mmetsp:Transcript_8912/g.14812  ORF Transcript_8912/g.14812 Transcript_8912/m.14812 type:complete len:198 (-) Transcript_8912:144-737(-)